jgi:hypothetical protein
MNNYLEYLTNPTKYLNNQRKMCELVNILIYDSETLLNNLTESQKEIIRNKHPNMISLKPINNTGQLGFLNCSNEKMINQIFDRYKDIYYFYKRNKSYNDIDEEDMPSAVPIIEDKVCETKIKSYLDEFYPLNNILNTDIKDEDYKILQRIYGYSPVNLEKLRKCLISLGYNPDPLPKIPLRPPLRPGLGAPAAPAGPPRGLGPAGPAEPAGPGPARGLGPAGPVREPGPAGPPRGLGFGGPGSGSGPSTIPEIKVVPGTSCDMDRQSMISAIILSEFGTSDTINFTQYTKLVTIVIFNRLKEDQLRTCLFELGYRNQPDNLSIKKSATAPPTSIPSIPNIEIVPAGSKCNSVRQKIVTDLISGLNLLDINIIDLVNYNKLVGLGLAKPIANRISENQLRTCLFELGYRNQPDNLSIKKLSGLPTQIPKIEKKLDETCDATKIAKINIELEKLSDKNNINLIDYITLFKGVNILGYSEDELINCLNELKYCNVNDSIQKSIGDPKNIEGDIKPVLLRDITGEFFMPFACQDDSQIYYYFSIINHIKDVIMKFDKNGKLIDNTSQQDRIDRMKKVYDKISNEIKNNYNQAFFNWLNNIVVADNLEDLIKLSETEFTNFIEIKVRLIKIFNIKINTTGSIDLDDDEQYEQSTGGTNPDGSAKIIMYPYSDDNKSSKYFTILLYELNNLIRKRYKSKGHLINPSKLNDAEKIRWAFLIRKANLYKESMSRFISSLDNTDKTEFINHNNDYASLSDDAYLKIYETGRTLLFIFAPIPNKDTNLKNKYLKYKKKYMELKNNYGEH